ncbi:hypothetical protein [Mucilaginibacter antarcticus]|uniref:Uncharacterized protein n=1 Tax=Mucilaginibacter antarcticus TaxID=1855725 RepID=A0ABW5XHL5_9SPHI
MLNRVVSIFLLVTLISTNFSRFFIYAGFQVNKSYIAAQLCENKARPWMNCNGSCFLMKKLKAAEEKEKKQEQEAKRSHYQEALAPATAITFTQPVQIISYPLAATPDVVSRSLPVFQPPKIA